MILPNFLIIGAPKSGTTALYYYLKQHPEIFMSPVKETNFFAFEGKTLDYRGPGDMAHIAHSVTTLEKYTALFNGVRGEKAIGEASPSYLAAPAAADKIKSLIPGARLIVILRNPADRAFSAYMHRRREGTETLRFEDALAAEEDRKKDNWLETWHYRGAGFYHASLERYLERFDRDRIRVYLHEEFSERPGELLQDIFRFLDVDPGFLPDMSFRPNRSGLTRSRRVENFLMRPHPVKQALRSFFPEVVRLRIIYGLRNLNLAQRSMPESTRKRLLEEYREDIEKLERLLGRDLSIWTRSS